ncbi:hypothetical protein BGZ91_011876 [Linnemannia elongata]|nr:hypothetical protein BGZ91_011876 [Linnemannia elongata]
MDPTNPGSLIKNPADFQHIDLVTNTKDFIGPFFLYLAYGTRGMGEFLVCVVLVGLGVLGAVPVAFRAVQDHTHDEGDDIIELGDKQELYDVKN